jgi:hypothetical protein
MVGGLISLWTIYLSSGFAVFVGCRWCGGVLRVSDTSLFELVEYCSHGVLESSFLSCDDRLTLSSPSVKEAN